MNRSKPRPDSVVHRFRNVIAFLLTLIFIGPPLFGHEVPGEARALKSNTPSHRSCHSILGFYSGSSDQEQMRHVLEYGFRNTPLDYPVVVSPWWVDLFDYLKGNSTAFKNRKYLKEIDFENQKYKSLFINLHNYLVPWGENEFHELNVMARTREPFRAEFFELFNGAYFNMSKAKSFSEFRAIHQNYIEKKLEISMWSDLVGETAILLNNLEMNLVNKSATSRSEIKYEIKQRLEAMKKELLFVDMNRLKHIETVPNLLREERLRIHYLEKRQKAIDSINEFTETLEGIQNPQPPSIVRMRNSQEVFLALESWLKVFRGQIPVALPRQPLKVTTADSILKQLIKTIGQKQDQLISVFETEPEVSYFVQRELKWLKTSWRMIKKSGVSIPKFDGVWLRLMNDIDFILGPQKDYSNELRHLQSLRKVIRRISSPELLYEISGVVTRRGLSLFIRETLLNEALNFPEMARVILTLSIKEQDLESQSYEEDPARAMDQIRFAISFEKSQERFMEFLCLVMGTGGDSSLLYDTLRSQLELIKSVRRQFLSHHFGERQYRLLVDEAEMRIKLKYEDRIKQFQYLSSRSIIEGWDSEDWFRSYYLNDPAWLINDDFAHADHLFSVEVARRSMNSDQLHLLHYETENYLNSHVEGQSNLARTDQGFINPGTFDMNSRFIPDLSFELDLFLGPTGTLDFVHLNFGNQQFFALPMIDKVKTQILKVLNQESSLNRQLEDNHE